jgi:hypothetical protein
MYIMQVDSILLKIRSKHMYFLHLDSLEQDKIS